MIGARSQRTFAVAPFGRPTAVARGAQAAQLCIRPAEMLFGACSAAMRDAISHMRLHVPAAVASQAECHATLIPQASLAVLLDAMVALSVRPGLVDGAEALLAVSSGADEELTGGAVDDAARSRLGRDGFDAYICSRCSSTDGSIIRIRGVLFLFIGRFVFVWSIFYLNLVSVDSAKH